MLYLEWFGLSQRNHFYSDRAWKTTKKRKFRGNIAVGILGTTARCSNVLESDSPEKVPSVSKAIESYQKSKNGRSQYQRWYFGLRGVSQMSCKMWVILKIIFTMLRTRSNNWNSSQIVSVNFFLIFKALIASNVLFAIRFFDICFWNTFQAIGKCPNARSAN